MAWIEQTGQHAWRVRYPHGDGHGRYGSVSGFTTAKAARDYANDLESDDAAASGSIQRPRRPPRQPDVTLWLKDLRKRYAASTVAGILTVFSMMLDDAVDQHLIPANPVHRRRRRGRGHAPTRAEKVFAMPEHILRIAEQATMLGGPSAGLLVITAAWTGCRWGELAGLQRDQVHLDRRVIVIDPEFGALHESAHGLWLGPPKTPASARTISLPPFLVELLREHLATTIGTFVFTSRLGCQLRRSTFDRRVFRPAVEGDSRKGMFPVRSGLTFHGLRHSHKTWLIADKIPEIAQARRLGHHLSNRLAEVYSHVARRSKPNYSPTSNAAGTTPTKPADPQITDPDVRHRHPGQHHVHPTALPRYAPPTNTATGTLDRSSPRRAASE